MTTAPAPSRPRASGVRGLPAPYPAQRGARQIRVMIVDDSLTVRAILKRMVESDPALVVTGTAGSAETALAQLAAETPDVLLLDLEMPGMHGLEALPAIRRLAPELQVLVVSALTEEGAEATLAALAIGAADTMLKPRPGEFTEEYRGALVARIRALGARMLDDTAPAGLADKRPGKAIPVPPTAAPPALPVLKRPDIVAIGASTGGIHALGLLLGRLPRSLAQPILVTQHLPASFMPVFARQIEGSCGRPACVAQDGLVIAPGSIVIASGAGHLTVRRAEERLVVQVCDKPAASGCRPSVDPMLASLAEACGSRTLAVILSGMGSDGLAGAHALATAGGTIIAQDADSSAVWGMPGVVTRAGLASLVAPPETLGDALAACAALRSRT